MDDVRREVQIMHHLKGHDNIVTLIGAYEDKQSIHLVSNTSRLPLSNAWDIMALSNAQL